MTVDNQKPIRAGDPVWIKDAFGEWHPSIARSGLTMSAGPGARWPCYLVDWDRPRRGTSGLVPRCNWSATHVELRTGQEPPLLGAEGDVVAEEAEDGLDGEPLVGPQPSLPPEGDGGVEQVAEHTDSVDGAARSGNDAPESSEMYRCPRCGEYHPEDMFW